MWACVLMDSSSGGAEIASSGGTVLRQCGRGRLTGRQGRPAGRATRSPQINGRTITGSDGFISTISNYKPGDTVTLTVREPSGQTDKLKVTLGVRPASAPTAG